MPVYFARAGKTGPVKIGYAKDDPEKRVKYLQTGCPEQLEILYVINKCVRTFEGFLHKEFAKYKIRGEWFTYSPEIDKFIHWHRQLERDTAKRRTERLLRKMEEMEDRIQEQEEQRQQEEYEERCQQEDEDRYYQQMEEDQCPQE